MIVWTVNKPTSEELEYFVYAFRDSRFSEHLMGDCDLATIPLDTGILNLVIPRSPGTLEELQQVWHLQVTPFYPYTDIVLTPNGYTGLTSGSEDTMRVRVRGFKTESISLWTHGYQAFVSGVQKKSFNPSGLLPWFVTQPDATRRFEFNLPEPGSKHVPLSLSQEYAPIEYLCSP
jgi:hypothetical protein